MISVIVPVYNSEKYIARCIDSILAQSYKDIELILVNDGSSDASPEICDSYAARDFRVHVIHKENGGVSSARNAGLEIAAGDYIAFVDSDDYIDSEMYQSMIDTARKYDCDVIMCDCVKEYPHAEAPYTHPIRPGFYSKEQLYSEYYPHLLMMENVEYPPTISTCTLLWKRTLRTPDMRYEPGIRYSEDLLFGAKLLRSAQSFYYLKNCAFYHYVMNEQSASHTFVPDKFEDYKRLYKKIQDTFLSDLEFDFREQVDLCLLFFLYNAVGDFYNANQLSDAAKREHILNILREEIVRDMFKRIKVTQLPISAKQKILSLIYKFSIGIYALIKYYH